MLNRWMRIFGLVFFSFFAQCGFCSSSWHMDLQEPVTSVARQQYHLHVLTMVIILVIFIVVFGMLFWVVFAYRSSRGHKPSRFKHSNVLELIWTVIPLVIVVYIAYSATQTVIDMRDTSNPDITIKVTGYQWKWGLDYLSGQGSGISFLSTLSTPYDQVLDDKLVKNPYYLLEVDHPLVVPVHKKIRILTTSADVVHAWYVPALGVKQDAIPGLLRDAWFQVDKEGIYRGGCSVLCGRNHAFMPIEVHAVSQADYDKWVKGTLGAMTPKEDLNKKYTKDELMLKGKEMYQACVACHHENGKGVPGAFPALDGSPVATGPVNVHIHQVLFGKAAMPAFGSVLTDTEIAAVVTYERNSWSNHTGDLVQPSEVHALRLKGA
ncbi:MULTISPECIES: cytochrome c oxidase subunit II [Candidatus Ichthyocystis]|uniref:Cytochrome c oxidase subunit 2 n=1 Tax=Candidatus Ichthyocystis hellenicum TaxID=1561003 RepID=A0A0S4LZP1_9BURK|nr:MULTISPECIES: cytochrome c oxidase subunit II [Ichthyocystis]CUT17015.1 Cytochrome C oxidase subunit II [Candidatus Ichthyocystis hellenicum]